MALKNELEVQLGDFAQELDAVLKQNSFLMVELASLERVTRSTTGKWRRWSGLI